MQNGVRTTSAKVCGGSLSRESGFLSLFVVPFEETGD